MNLTAITQPDQVAKLHLLDSLTVLTAADLRGKQIIDVGCGAGFPGVPLAITCPEARVTLLDSLGKRMKWLEEILPQLGVRAQCVTARAEEAAAERRERYDYAVSRAVARLNILLELTAPYVKVGGAVLAMKGSAARGRAGRVYIRDQKAGVTAGIGKGIFHRRGVPRGHRPAEDHPHAEAVPPPLREDQAVSTLRHFGK